MQKIREIFNSNLSHNYAELRTLILTTLGTALLSTVVLAALNINRPFMIFLSGVLLISMIFTYMGLTVVGSWTTLLAGLVILSLLVFKNNGIRDTAVMGLIVVLIAAGLLAGKAGTVVIGSIIVLEIGVYGVLESLGMVKNQLNAQNYFGDYLALSIAVSMVTVLQWMVINQLNKTIENSKLELSERKRYQAQLQEAETQYRELVERIPLALYTSEPGFSGVWHFVSPQIEPMTGFAPQEWLDDPGLWYSCIHPEDRNQIMEEESQALQNGKMLKLEYRLITRDGKTIWVYDESLILHHSDHQMIVQGFLLDITDRKLAEEQLTKRLAELQAVHGISKTLIQRNDVQNLIHETGEQIRLSFKASNVLIAIHDLGTNLIHFPYDYEDGVSRKDIPIRYGEGMTTRIMELKKPLLINDRWDEHAKDLNAIITNRIPVKSSFSVPIMTPEQVIGVITLESNEREYAFAEIDTRPLLIIAANLAVAIEKTRLQDSLKRELEIQERLIRELEMKNEELERFTYTASHDLKSPLITIRGFLGYLEHDARSGNFERLQADIQRISDATEKMHRLLSELLELSRIGRVANKKEEVPFEVIISEALKRVEGQLKEKKVMVRTGSGFPSVQADRERIIEVVQNLVDNAAKFTSPMREPDIEINYYLHNNVPVFYVRDNGIGIKKEFQKRVFGLFDKLDPATEGTGVGLALVKRIIEVHNGNIWIESEEGTGTTFYFTLNE